MQHSDWLRAVPYMTPHTGAGVAGRNRTRSPSIEKVLTSNVFSVVVKKDKHFVLSKRVGLFLNITEGLTFAQWYSLTLPKELLKHLFQNY